MSLAQTTRRRPTPLTRQFSLPARLVMLDDSGMPLLHEYVEATFRRMTEDETVFECPIGSHLSGRILAGVEWPSGEYRFAILVITERMLSDDFVRFHCRQVEQPDDLLSPQYLEPKLHPLTRRMEPSGDPGVIEALVRLNVLESRVHDRISCCPDCSGVVSIRAGCRHCGSINTASERLIHHFACAHVGTIDSFATDKGQRCPKCLTKDLVVGADFEYFDGVTRCADCHAEDTKPGLVAECLACGSRFPHELATERDVIAYDVDRLDLLAVDALAG